MFIEHLDQLRCTSDHEDSWLVAAFQRRDERYILDATLGCHICYREYPIINGVVYFGETPAKSPRPTVTANPEMAMRVAAFLNVREGATIVLGGSWGDAAHEVAALMPLRVFALDPIGEVDDSERVSTIRSREGIPLAPASLHGVALDAESATANNLHSMLRVLAPGGRLVLPAQVTIPAGVQELARDDQYIVGEVSPSVVQLRRNARV